MAAARPFASPPTHGRSGRQDLVVTRSALTGSKHLRRIRGLGSEGGAGSGQEGGEAGCGGDAGSVGRHEQSGDERRATKCDVGSPRPTGAYEARFGYIFIVCATGKSADEMLAILERRLANEPVVELRIAADEQRKITRLRLAKLRVRSMITTHVLDTARGRPGAGVDGHSRNAATERVDSRRPRHHGRERAAVTPLTRRSAVARHVSADVRHGRLPARARDRAPVLSRGQDRLQRRRRGGALPCAAAAQPLRILDVSWVPEGM